MKITQALLIFDNIESDAFTNDEKAIAIRFVLDMPTKNSVTKDSICKAFSWMWNKYYVIEEIKK